VCTWRGVTLCVISTLLPATAVGQQGHPRSQDYLFISAVDDARSAWVNPAGLGWIPEASVMAEVAVNRSAGSMRLGQYTVGLNSRGLALSYERDRSIPDSSIGVARIALGLPLGNGSVGASFSTYGSRHNQGIELGARYRVLPELDAAVVVRNLKRPLVHGTPQPIVGVAGATWTLGAHVAAASAEALATERPGLSGYDLNYRAGIELHVAEPWPLTIHLATEISGQGSVRRWTIGLMFGWVDHVGVVAGATPVTGLGEPDKFSALAVASQRAPVRP
jgi:hypothetical protein